MIGMLKKEKAQVSIELILITGAFIVMALTMMPLIFSNFELSKAIAAAREGAEFAIAMRGMGYDTPSGGITNIPEGAIKIKNITLEIPSGYCANVTGKKGYQIQFNILIPSYINSTQASSIGTTVQAYAKGNLYRAFYGTYDASPPYRVETDRYCFTTAASSISY